MLTDFPRCFPTACHCTFQTRWKDVERREQRRWVWLRLSRDTIWKGRTGAWLSTLHLVLLTEDLCSLTKIINWPISIISVHSGNDSGTTSLLAELFESVVTIVDQHGDDLTSSFGGAAVQAVVQSLNKVCLLQLRVSSFHVCKKYLHLFLHFEVTHQSIFKHETNTCFFAGVWCLWYPASEKIYCTPPFKHIPNVRCT